METTTSRFNADSAEFVPGPMVKNPSNNDSPEVNARLHMLASKLKQLGVLDDEATSGNGSEDFSAGLQFSSPNTANGSRSISPPKNPGFGSSIGLDDSGVGRSDVSPTKSLDSTQPGPGTKSGSLVSSLRAVAENSAAPAGSLFSDMDNTKTTSQTISVPSSEHVAEIVGKQGCKIKALRAKTNTYIKTPSRVEDPMFTVTGHANDVQAAIREIQEAAEHFTMIRQQRSRQHFMHNQEKPEPIPFSLKEPHPLSSSYRQQRESPTNMHSSRQRRPGPNSMGNTHSTISSIMGNPFDRARSHAGSVSDEEETKTQMTFGGYTIEDFDPSLLANQTSLRVRVPFNVVGLVVGPKGSTIKRIQTMTQTYIVTPSRDKEPVFEVTGLPANVERARDEIQTLIATRTGSNNLDIEEDFRQNGIEKELPALDLTDIPRHSPHLNIGPPPGFSRGSPSPAGGDFPNAQSTARKPYSTKPPMFTSNPLRHGFEVPSPCEISTPKPAVDKELSLFELSAGPVSPPGSNSGPKAPSFLESVMPGISAQLEDEEASALESLEKLTPEEKVKLGKVIEDMKKEAAKEKRQHQGRQGSGGKSGKSIFEPTTLQNVKPAPSIDNVLIGKASPGQSNNPLNNAMKAYGETPSFDRYNQQPPRSPYGSSNHTPHYRLPEPGPSYHGPRHGRDYPPNHQHHHYYGPPPPHARSPYPDPYYGHPPPPRHYRGDSPSANILSSMVSQRGYEFDTGKAPVVAGVNRYGKCLVCREAPISMALVPCGHNLFCETCAVRITQGNKNLDSNPVCPECFEPVNMAIRIKMKGYMG